MLLYHGSNKLFEEFDFSVSEHGICLSPHIEYAKDYAFFKVQQLLFQYLCLLQFLLKIRN